MKITEISVKRPVFTLMVYFGITVFSMYALYKLPVDLYPEMENPVISVVTLYPGASSVDVEEKVTKILEKNLAIIPNLDSIESSSFEGYSVIMLKFDYETNLDESANDIRSAIDLSKKFLPDQVENPMLFKFSTNLFPVYFFAVTSKNRDISKMKDYLEDNIVQYLQTIPGVGSASIFRIAPEEVHIDARVMDLNKKHLTLQNIKQVVATSNVSVPAGSIENRYYDLPVRVPAEFSSIDEIRDTIIGSFNGKPVFLKEVADVYKGYKRLKSIAKLNNQNVSVIFVQKQSGANTVEIAQKVKEKLKEIRKNIPDDINFIEIFDGSKFITTMIDNLYNAMLLGGIFVIIVVLLFLRRFKASFIIAISLPSSVVISFLLLYLAGYTINGISLLSMSLAIGMVVDNSIVVLENITRRIENRENPIKASVFGTKQVGLAITASTLTTIGIFAPMMFVSGIVKIMFGQLAFVMIVTLGASLVTSIFLTPMLTSRLLKVEDKNRKISLREKAFGAIEKVYNKLIRFSLNHKLLVIVFMIFLFFSSVFLISRVGFNFLPQMDTGDIDITVELPPGVSVDVSEKLGEELYRDFSKFKEVKRVFFRAGTSSTGFGAAMGRAEGVNLLNLHVKLLPVDKRKIGVKEIALKLQKIIEAKKNVVSYTVKVGSMMTGGGKVSNPIEIQVMGSDYERMKKAAREVKKVLSEISGVINISADIAYEKPEVNIDIDRQRASQLGVNIYLATDIINTAILGKTISRYRAEGKDVDIVLKLRDEDISDINKIKNITVPTFTGKPTRISNFTTVSSGFSPIQINHSSLLKVIKVTAENYNITLDEFAKEFKKRIAPLRAKYPDIVFNFGGELKEQQETKFDLMIVLILGILLTYMIMASQFESFLDPFVIMFSVPFAFTGSFLFLFITGADFNLIAFLGVIMLVGIVVNNGIVMIDYINQRRMEGEPLKEAVSNAATIRLRPILMTALTTIFGMLPLALAHGEGYELWQPIGVTVIGGLLFSTLITLVLIPVMYAAFEKIRLKKFKKISFE